jgi:DNA-binding beta-propeller fold protein YncE
MRARLAVVSIIVAIAAVLWGCADNENGPAGCPVPGRTPALFVVNGLAETLARYDIASRAVTCQRVILGREDAIAAPNAALVHGDRIYIVNSLANTVDAFSLPGLSRAGAVDIGAGNSPWAIAVAGDHAFVTNWQSGDLVRVDLGSLAVTGRTHAGTGAEGLAVAAGRVFVANSGYDLSTYSYGPGTVTVHDEDTGAVEDTLFVGVNPQVVLVDSSGVVHVLCTGDYGALRGRVFFVDPAIPAVIDSLELGGSPGFAALADSGKVFVSGASGGLMLYDASRRVVLRGPGDPVYDGGNLWGLAFDPEEQRLYVSDFDDDGVRVFDTVTGAQLASFASGDGPVACAFYRP